MGKEFLSVHVGQAGVQMGKACWQLFCLEHGLTEVGQADAGRSPNCPNFFHETETGRHIPRALFADLSPTTQDIVQSGAYGHLFDPGQTVVARSDAAGLYSRGYYTAGKHHLEATVEALRQQAELADNLQGFLVQRALGGGTGAGFGSLLLERLTGDFPKTPLLEIAVFPWDHMSPYTVEPYNTVLSAHTGLEYTNIACSFLLDNAAMYKLCRTKLDVEVPRYAELNDLSAGVVSSLTATLRFPPESLVSEGDDVVDLTPLPRLHFPLVSQAPVTPPDAQYLYQPAVLDLTRQSLNPDNALLSCNLKKGRIIAYSALYRGSDIREADLDDCTEELRHGLQEVTDWCPGGSLVSIHPHPLVATPGGVLGNPKRTATLIANTTAVRELWERLLENFQALYSSHAFVHWYLEEGMEEEEFHEAFEDMVVLLHDYEEVDSLATGGGPSINDVMQQHGRGGSSLLGEE